MFSQPETPVSSGSASCFSGAKRASMVWALRTLSKVYLSTAPTLSPSTSTSAISYPASGVMRKVLSLPRLTRTLPSGLIPPPWPALAAMVYRVVPVLPPPL